MVLVSVSEHHSAYLVGICLKIAYVGNYKVNSRHLLVGKAKSAVDYYNIVLILDNSKVFSDLVKSAKRNYLNFTFLFFWHTFSISVCFGAQKMHAKKRPRRFPTPLPENPFEANIDF